VNGKSLYGRLGSLSPWLSAGGTVRAEASGTDVTGKSVARNNHTFSFLQGFYDGFLMRPCFNMSLDKFAVFFQFVKFWLRLGNRLGNRAVEPVNGVGVYAVQGSGADTSEHCGFLRQPASKATGIFSVENLSLQPFSPVKKIC
jgi:hypothetical protein